MQQFLLYYYYMPLLDTELEWFLIYTGELPRKNNYLYSYLSGKSYRDQIESRYTK